MTDPAHPEISTDHPCESADAKLRALFDQVIDLPESARATWIAEHVPDSALRLALYKLIATDAGKGPFDASATQRIEHFDRVAKATLDGLIGSRIGAYRIERLLGQGGMATVFLAARTVGDFDQHVAIKLLRKGLYSEAEQRQFRREQRALAALTHPNIAYLIDGGITEAGLPYLVLEYVDGLPLTQYATQQSLNMQARLQLFLGICRAVAAAHRQLVVHRDLKPSNILVKANGDVKLLDFGIAKLLDDDAEAQTQTGLVALTPEYAAPEQRVGGTITTSTDVYALGVLLHELLIGRRPIDDEAGQRRPSSLLLHTSAHADALPARAVPLTTLRQQLRGDLDNIILMALAQEPERRYRSAAEFADDMQRHLDAQPVLAHPPSRWYRVQKFVSRHRGGVTMGAILGIATIAALLIALWQTQLARTQALLANKEAQRAQSVRELLVGLFENEVPGTSLATLPDTATLLQRGVERVRRELRSTPSLQADMLITIGRVYTQLSRFSEARPLLEQAAEIAKSQAETEPALHATALSQLGELERNTGRYDDALRQFDSALAIQQGIQANSLVAALTLHRRALAFSETGRHDQALADYDASRQIRELLLPPGDRLVIASIGAKGTALGRAGRPDEAEPWARRALELARTELGEEHEETARRWANLGFILLMSEQLIPAEEAIETALTIQRQVYRGQHSMFATGNYNLGMVRIALGRLAAAEANWLETLRTEKAVGTPDSSLANSTKRQLARIALLRGDLDGALELARGAASGLEKRLPDGHATRVETAAFVLRLELLAMPTSDRRAAAQALLEKVQLRHPDRPVLRLSALFAIGLAEANVGNRTKAITHIREAIQSARSVKLMSDYESPLAWSLALAALHTQQNDLQAARSVLEQSLKDADTRGMAADHPAREPVKMRLAATQ